MVKKLFSKNPEKKIKGVIFDLDGTLVESFEAIDLGLKECFDYLKKEDPPVQDIKKYLKGDVETTLSQFFTAEEILKVVPVMIKKYEEVYLEKAHLHPGAKELLNRLYDDGLLLGIVSDKFGPFVRRTLDHLGVIRYFKSVIGAGDTSRNKPFPDMIETALKEMKLSPDEIVFVGDSPIDIQMGKEAGVDVYALTTGYYSKKELAKEKPRRILKDFEELAIVIKNPFQKP